MKRKRLLLLCFVAGCFSVARRDHVPPDTYRLFCPPDRAPDATLPTDLAVSTYNVHLATGLAPNVSSRAPFVASEVGKLREHDVVCVQEAWSEDAKAEIVKALGLPKNHAFYVDTRGRHESAANVCEAGRLDGLLACVKKNCDDVDDEDTARCAYEHCKPSLLWIKLRASECLHCLIATAGKGIDAAAAVCTGKGATRYHDGSNGVVLASRHALENVEVVDLPGSGANRVAILARVKGVEVACTHVSSTTDGDAPLEKRFKSWTDEQTTQLKLISDRLMHRAAGRPQLLVGDLNVGPELEKPDISAYSIDGWHALLRLGFSSPLASQKPPLCTICADNRIRNFGKGGQIDHVMLRDPPGGTELAPLCSTRFGMETIEIVDTRGRRVTTHPSDHYGVTTRLRVTKK